MPQGADMPHSPPITHTGRKAHVLGNTNQSSASLCIHEFCLDMKRAQEFMTRIQHGIHKSCT